MTNKAAFGLMRDGDRGFMQAFLGTLVKCEHEEFVLTIGGGDIFEYELAQGKCVGGGYGEWKEDVETLSGRGGSGGMIVKWESSKNSTSVSPVPGLFGTEEGDIERVYRCFGKFIRDENVRKQSVELMREVARWAYWGGKVRTGMSGGVVVTIEKGL